MRWRLNAKEDSGSEERDEKSGIAERAGKGKIREARQHKAVVVKKKNEAYISGPTDDDTTLGTRIHTRIYAQKDLFRCHHHSPDSRSATASKGCEDDKTIMD